eukprot:755098_1
MPRPLGRLELLSWANSVLEMDYAKLEDFGDGIGYCFLLDAVFEGSVSLNVLNFNPSFPGDREYNLRILRRGLAKLEIDQPVECAKLARFSFLDNFNLLQWFRKFLLEKNPAAAETYPAAAKRLAVQEKQHKIQELKRQRATVHNPSRQLLRINPDLGRPPATPEFHVESVTASPTQSQHERELARLIATLETDLRHRLATQTKLLGNVEGIRSERDFYLDKLERIEKFCDSDVNQQEEGHLKYRHEVTQILLETTPIFKPIEDNQEVKIEK